MQKLHKNKLSHLLYESNLNQLHSQDIKENLVYKGGIKSLLNESQHINVKVVDSDELLQTILDALEDDKVVRVIDKNQKGIETDIILRNMNPK